MHSAPSVTFPVGRSRFYAISAAAVWLLCGGVAAFWWVQTDAVGWRQGLMGVLWLISGGLLLVTWQRAPQGALRWDGRTWGWQAMAGARSKSGSGAPRGSVSGTLVLHLDVQHTMLARLHATDGSLVWLWLERHVDATHWNALRRAVFTAADKAPATSRDALPDIQTAGHEARP